jgi:hypothetical protein
MDTGRRLASLRRRWVPPLALPGAVTVCCGLGDHTIAGRSNWRFLSPSRRPLLGAGRESHPHRNNSEHGNQKQRRDRASHGTPPFTQGMDGITEGAARQCGFVLPRAGGGQSALSSPRWPPIDHGPGIGWRSIAGPPRSGACMTKASSSTVAESIDASFPVFARAPPRPESPLMRGAVGCAAATQTSVRRCSATVVQPRSAGGWFARVVLHLARWVTP